MFKKFFAIGAICLLCVVPTALATDGPQQGETLVDTVVDFFKDLADWLGDFSTTNDDGEGEDDGDPTPDYTGAPDPIG